MSDFGDRTVVSKPCCYEKMGRVRRDLRLTLKINKYNFKYTMDLALHKDEEKEVECVDVHPPYGQPDMKYSCPDFEPEVKTSCSNSFRLNDQNLDSTFWSEGVAEGQGDFEGPQRDYTIFLYLNWMRRHFGTGVETGLSFGLVNIYAGKLCCNCVPKCAAARGFPYNYGTWDDTTVNPGDFSLFQRKCANHKKDVSKNCTVEGTLEGGQSEMDELIDGLNAASDDEHESLGYVEGSAWQSLLEEAGLELRSMMDCQFLSPDCKCASYEDGPHIVLSDVPHPPDYKIRFCANNMYPDGGSEVVMGWTKTMEEGNGGRC